MLVLDASAQDNYTSAQSGDWNVSSTWTSPSWLPNTTPDNSQTVTISAGHTVTYTGDLTYSQDITIDGTLIVTGSFTHGNFLTVSSTGSLIVGGNILTNGFNIAGKVKAEGNYTGTSGNTNIISSTGKILIGGNAQTSINITVFGEMLVSGNYTQTGGTININDTGFLVVGKNFQNDWQDVYINNSGKLLIIGSLITNEINKAPDAQIAVLGDLIIGTYNQTLENLDCSEYCKQSLDCPSCQILDVIDPTHPDWILSEGITSFWWEDFNENAVGSTSEGTKWTTIISGANSGANVQVLNSPNKVLYFSNNGSTGNKTLWQTEEIIIQCYKNVSISGYTYNESTGSTSINHLYYRLKATSAGTWGNWTQLSRSASGYNLAPDINAYSVQIKWAVNTNKSCWLDNVGVSGTAICGDESSLSITCPGDQTENLNSNCQYILPDYTSLATISGGDGTVSLAQSPVAGTIISTATLITITATDQGVGNENCSFNVILTDIEDPVLSSCPSDIFIVSSDGNPVVVSWTVPTATDNCSVNLSSDYNPGDNFPVGQTIVTYTATDDDGNSATCSFTVTVVDDLKLSAAAADIQCIGNNDGTITATASGGVDPYEYKINEGSYQSSGNFSNLSEGDYTVWVKDSQGVEADSTVTISQPTSADDQNLAGADSWIGHVYKRLDTQNSPPSDVNAFTNYVGNISENETFFHDFGGSCFQVYSSGAPFVTVDPNYFAVRYRMNSSKSGIYLVNIGSDDGARLTIDGDLVYNQWRERGLVTDQRNLIQLTGSSNLLLEYYESGGGNQIAFDVLEKVSNEITADVMTSCGTTLATPISGNNAYTESPISSNTNFSISYQWQGASDLSGSWGDIDGATSQNYTPTLSIADTYYFRRILFVEKTNPGGIHVTAKDTSNVSTVVHYNIQLSSLIKNTSCNGFSDGEIDLTVSGGVSPYSFVWTSTDGVGYVASDEDQTGLTAGTYEVTVTDNNGCTSTGGYTVDIAEDVTKPSISCPAGGIYDCVKNIQPKVNDPTSFSYAEFIALGAGYSASDNCTTSDNLVFSYVDVIDPGMNCNVTRIYTVKDEAVSANTATCQQVFQIQDQNEPELTCTDLEFQPNNGCVATETITAPNDSDFCSYGDEAASYSYYLNGDPVEKTGSGNFTANFPLGTTIIIWTLTDDCGNTGTCSQNVIVYIPITPISYDNETSDTGSGSGVQPLQTSTHTYQVDGGISESGYTYDWELEDGSGNVVTSGYSINGDGTASISITYNTDTDTLSTGNYILSIRKSKNTTICEQSQTLAISVLSNGGFDVSIEDLSDQQCQTPSSTTTTYIWQITFQDESGINQPFQFDYEVQLEGSTMQSGTVGLFSLSGEWNLKPPASGDFPLVQTRKVANSSIIELVFTFANAPDLDRNIQVVIQNTKGAYSVSEPDVTNNTDAVKASKIPTISFE